MPETNPVQTISKIKYRKSDGIPTLGSETNEDFEVGNHIPITCSDSAQSEMTSLSRKFFERPLSNYLASSGPVAQPIHPILPHIRQAKYGGDMKETVRKVQRLPPIREALKAEPHDSEMRANSGQNDSKKSLNKSRRYQRNQHCHCCNRYETPEWRRGPDGPGTLCNACGRKYVKATRRVCPSI